MKTTIIASFAALLIAPLAEAQCIGDIAIDARVDGGDLGVLLANWGPVTSTALSHACDLDGDAIVNGADLGLLLNGWGACPPSPPWANIIEIQPDPAVVTDPALRASIVATRLPWRVSDRGTGIEMLLIPPGTFQMGCIMGSDQWACLESDQPVHHVNLTRAFYIGRYEVTQAQWTAKMGSNPSYFQEANGFPGSTDRPVDKFTWNMIQPYLSTVGMRLPTEAEWEYACRAGTQTPFYNGSTDDNTVGALSWCYQNSGGQTHAVGGKAPNGFGLYDMLGNAMEWVNDWVGNYYADSQTNPTGPASGYTHVLRGGYFGSVSANVQSSNRISYSAEVLLAGTGFRVARNP